MMKIQACWNTSDYSQPIRWFSFLSFLDPYLHVWNHYDLLITSKDITNKKFYNNKNCIPNYPCFEMLLISYYRLFSKPLNLFDILRASLIILEKVRQTWFTKKLLSFLFGCLSISKNKIIYYFLLQLLPFKESCHSMVCILFSFV